MVCFPTDYIGQRLFYKYYLDLRSASNILKPASIAKSVTDILPPLTLWFGAFVSLVF